MMNMPVALRFRLFRATALALAVSAGFSVAGPAADRAAALFESQDLAVEAPVLTSYIQDLNLDGLVDFAFLAEDRRFVIFLQQDAGRFRRGEAKYVMPAGTDSLDLADTDGDGVPDICLTVEGRLLRVIPSAGRRTFWEDQVTAGTVDGAGALDIELVRAGQGTVPAPLTDSLHRSPDVIWDLDGDGRQDLLYPGFDGLQILFNNQGDDGSAAPPFSSTKRQIFPHGPRVSLSGTRIEVRREMPRPIDLDHDGRPEVVFDPRPVHGLGQLECGWCRYAEGVGELQWIGHDLQFGVGESVTDYLLDDFSGDSMPDLAVISCGFSFDDPGGGQGSVSGGGSFFEEKKLRVWTSGAGGAMGRAPAGQWTSEVNLWQETVMRYRDLTGDGEGDLCLFYYKGLITARLQVDIYPGLGHGRFGGLIKGQKIGFDSAEREVILVDHDLDGDGLQDMVLVAEDQIRVHLRGPSAGSKSEPFSVRPWAVLDLRPEAAGSEGEGQETMTFSLGSTGTSLSFDANRLEGVRIMEINGDGAPDLVVVNRPAGWNDKMGRSTLFLKLHLSAGR
jgi:hypothetical protein